MCTFTDKKLSVCGFGLNASWITLREDFPGVMPVSTMQGWVDSVVVADGHGVLWQCGLPTGHWGRFNPQPPTSISFKQFLGGRWDISGDVYMAAFGSDGGVWIIGNPTAGGQWVSPPNLRPPGNAGPFGLNTNNFMCAFTGTTLHVCEINTVARWISAEQFRGSMPVRAMYGYEESLLVIDGNGVISRVGLPTGSWVKDIRQHTQPATIKEVMGMGYDDSGGEYLAALDTAGTAWLVGNPTGGGHWVAPRISHLQRVWRSR